jgi:hypothetical protein
MEQERPQRPLTDSAPAPVEAIAPPAPVDHTDARLVNVGAVLVRWERLRIAYNLVLAAWTVLLTVPGMFAAWMSIDFLDAVLFGAIGANLCYSAGAVIEGYITWFVGTNRAITAVLFGLGLVLSMFLTLAVVALV